MFYPYFDKIAMSSICFILYGNITNGITIPVYQTIQAL